MHGMNCVLYNKIDGQIWTDQIGNNEGILLLRRLHIMAKIGVLIKMKCSEECWM